jgi:F420H(2)-dependent quinone reductase
MAEIPDDLAAANRKLIDEFRAAGRSLPGRPLLLLTTTGARTGQPRTNPMMYVRVDDRLLVIASAAGSPKHPDWYHNLVAHPAVTVEADGAEYPATARPTEGADRDALFARIVEQYPFFTDHQAGVERTIPVVELIRR